MIWNILNTILLEWHMLWNRPWLIIPTSTAILAYHLWALGYMTTTVESDNFMSILLVINCIEEIETCIWNFCSHYSTLKRCKPFRFIFMDNKDISLSYGQHYSWWWPDDAMSPVISSHDIELILPDYPLLNTRRNDIDHRRIAIFAWRTVLSKQIAVLRS